MIFRALLAPVPQGSKLRETLGISAESPLRKVSFCEKYEKGDLLKSQLHQLKQLFFGQKLINMTLKYVICIMFSLIQYFHCCHKIKVTYPSSGDLLPAPSWVKSLQ